MANRPHAMLINPRTLTLRREAMSQVPAKIATNASVTESQRNRVNESPTAAMSTKMIDISIMATITERLSIGHVLKALHPE